MSELARIRPVQGVARAATLRCPHCGVGGVLQSWTRLRERCPQCGLLLNRGEQDHWIGAFALNLVIAEVLAVLLIGVAVLLTWPDVPWRLIQYGGVALMVIAPLALFPFSRLGWLVADLLFRPLTSADFERRAERRPLLDP